MSAARAFNPRPMPSQIPVAMAITFLARLYLDSGYVICPVGSKGGSCEGMLYVLGNRFVGSSTYHDRGLALCNFPCE